MTTSKTSLSDHTLYQLKKGGTANEDYDCSLSSRGTSTIASGLKQSSGNLLEGEVLRTAERDPLTTFFFDDLEGLDGGKRPSNNILF
jgi:hypothetical protein